MQRLGACLCRRIRFTVAGEPFTYAVCHCTNCQKFAGSAFMTNAFFNSQSVSVTEGQDVLRKYNDSDTTSGNTLTRSFCSECGTSLFLSSPTKTDWISVCPAAVEGSEGWVPRRENRPDARFPWVELHMTPKEKL
ncbi:DUF636 domain-containing protein [Mycena belliarum]|uniref:DUF636 domain-containing protein n=1 Tax=Mycena belliarum TaxID=1033014 RepID=A0AAD6XTC7_9AGAR|nr:DUF636 domain-containing protein [Mycena belliae]